MILWPHVSVTILCHDTEAACLSDDSMSWYYGRISVTIPWQGLAVLVDTQDVYNVFHGPSQVANKASLVSCRELPTHLYIFLVTWPRVAMIFVCLMKGHWRM